ncbi:MAG: fused MFS/spermidine synthase [Thermoguttaceae bacterium]|jgi:hypothetical protein
MHLFFALTLFTGATLLFVVEPMFAKMVLPRLGGSPAVWNTCMVFYQAALLAGYVYAHLSLRWLGPRRQAVFHLMLLALPWLTLPIAVHTPWLPSWGGPSVELLVLLTVSVGLPFFLVSSTAPMLQAWFAETRDEAARDPYFLYAASNLGSLASLLAYPLVIEPWLPLAQQSWAWTIGYGLLTALVAGCAVLLWRSPRAQVEIKSDVAPALSDERPTCPTAADRLRWLALSLVPSSLLLGVTTHISTDIAAVPLLWVIPLALYLLTFVLVFARRQWLPHAWMVRLQMYLVILLAVAFFQSFNDWSIPLMLLHLGTFFVTTMVCHGELARTRPQPRYLTEFYLWMSVGGVLGGLFNALIAPVLFPLLVEYPLVLAAACLLRPHEDAGLRRWREVLVPTGLVLAVDGVILAFKGQALTTQAVTILVFLSLAALGALLLGRRPRGFGLGVAAILVIGFLGSHRLDHLIHIERSFFGICQIKDSPFNNVRMLVHGSTNHGVQSLDPDRRTQALSYYCTTGPIGQVFDALAETKHWRKIGVIGLGTGTLASYGRQGQEFTFFEIDPAVARIAQNPQYFTFLRDTPAQVRIVLGDARLTLADEPDGQFDLLVLDAFSSDAIPMHLLTREALALYLRKLTAEGVLALHISNRYLDLGPLVGRLAEDAGVVCRISNDVKIDPKEQQGLKNASTWVALARQDQDLGKLTAEPRWKPIDVRPGDPLWTDDYSNILAAFTRGRQH